MQDALDISEKDDIIVIGKGEHHIRGAGNLEDGGTLKGIEKVDSTVICPKETESGPSLLDFSGKEVIELFKSFKIIFVLIKIEKNYLSNNLGQFGKCHD